MSAKVRIPGRNKYGVSAATDRTYEGRVYASKAEMHRAQELDVLKSAGKIKDWWAQVSFPINVNGTVVCKVVVDFRVLGNDLKDWYEETKGHETEVFRLKKKLLLACYPDLDYRVLYV